MKLLTTVFTLASCAAQVTYDVVVVGGGMSGLAAAGAARAKGWSVLILEARSRMGGRVWSNRDFGYSVDLGASWIHGTSGNPLTTLAAQAGAPCFTTDYELNSAFTSTGTKYTSAQATALDSQWSSFLASVSSAISARRDSGAPDVSLQSMVDAVIQAGSFSAAQLVTLNYSLTSMVEHEYATDASTLSAYNYDAGARIKGADCVFPLGYDALTQRLLQVNASGAVVMMGQNVTRVNTGGCTRSLPASVQTSSGALYLARSVVVTVPLGVLKRGRIVFTPPLPSALQASIARLDMGVLNKYAIEFATAPDNSDTDRWPSSETFMFNRIGPNKVSNVFPEYLNWQYVTAKTSEQSVKPAKRMLIGFASGAYALSQSAVSNAAISAQIRSELEQAMGTSLGPPTNFMRTQWELDEWAFGSYSYTPVGAAPSDRSAFSRSMPTSSCLRFAGEHTSATEPATVHGALNTGLAAIANLVLPSPSPSTSPAASSSAAPAAVPGAILQDASVNMPPIYVNAPSAAVTEASASLSADVLEALSVPSDGVDVDVTVSDAAPRRRLQAGTSTVAYMVRVDTRIRIVNAAAFHTAASRSPAPPIRTPTTPRGASALPSVATGAIIVNDSAVDAALTAVTAAVAQLQSFAGGGNFSASTVDGDESMCADDLLADFEDDLAVITGSSSGTINTYMSLQPPSVSRYVAILPTRSAAAASTATTGSSSSSSAALNAGAVAGIVIGSITGAALLVLLIVVATMHARCGRSQQVLSSAPANKGVTF